jgi:TRAP-type transport system periplasmic protein
MIASVNRRHLTLGGIALGAAGLLVACNIDAEPEQVGPFQVELVVAHEPPSPYFVDAMERFSSAVSARTAGQVVIKVATSRSFGAVDQAELVENLSKGELEMSAASVSVLGWFNEDLWVFEMPFLFRDYEHVASVIDGPIGDQLLEGLRPYGIRGLEYTYSGGFKILPTQSRAVRSPADLVGLRIRVPDNPVSEATFQSMGVSTLRGGISDIEELSRAGQIDGSELTYSRYFEHQLAGNIVNELHHSFFLTALMVNDSWFQGLPAEYQTVIQEEARVAALYERAETMKEIEAVRADCQKRAVERVTLNAAERAAFEEATRPVYQKFEGRYGKLVEQIRAVQ